MTFMGLRAANVKRCKESFHPINDWSPTDWGCALGGEVGELLNLIKKMRRGDSVSLTEVAKEAADVLAYLDLLCVRLGIDLESATIAKFNEVSERVKSTVRLP